MSWLVLQLLSKKGVTGQSISLLIVKSRAALPIPTRISIGVSGTRGLEDHQSWVHAHDRESVPIWSRRGPAGSWLVLMPHTYEDSFDIAVDRIGSALACCLKLTCCSTPTCCSTAVAVAVTVTLPYFLRRAVCMLDSLNIWSKLFETHRDHVHSIKREAVEQRSQQDGGAYA